MRALTRFGSIVVTAPAALVMVLWLARVAGREVALRFAAPIITTFVTIVALKFVMRATGGAFASTPLAFSAGAPSGHMGMGTVVYGGFTLLLLRRRRDAVSLSVAALTLFLLIAIGITRVTLHAHLPPDVAVGLLIGGSCAAWMAKTVTLPATLSEHDVARLLLIVAASIAIMHLSGLTLNSGKLI